LKNNLKNTTSILFARNGIEFVINDIQLKKQLNRKNNIIGINMKKFEISLVLILSSLFLFTLSCQDESTLSGPEQVFVSDENQLDKKDKKDKDSDKYTVSQLITIKNGGKITLKVTHKGEFLGKKNKKKIEIKAEIKFSPNTVIKDQKFKMTWDPIECMISFYPEMDFMKVAPLTISVKGVDLKKLKIKKGDVKFVYLDAAGDDLFVDSKKIWFKKDSFGILQAEISHFSRYGFTK